MEHNFSRAAECTYAALRYEFAVQHRTLLNEETAGRFTWTMRNGRPMASCMSALVLQEEEEAERSLLILAV